MLDKAEKVKRFLEDATPSTLLQVGDGSYTFIEVDEAYLTKLKTQLLVSIATGDVPSNPLELLGWWALMNHIEATYE